MNTGPWLGQVRLAQPQAFRPPPARPFLSGPRLGAAAVLNDGSFSQALSAPFAVVDFWSPTCPYCVQYKPVFEDAASQMGGGVFMATVNVQDSPQSAGKYNIQGIPATVFLASGKEVGRVEGTMSKEELLAQISRLSGQAPAAGSSGASWGLIAGGLAAAGLIAYVATR